MSTALKRTKTILISLILVFLSSCGYVEDKPVKDSRILIVDDLKTSCKIDTEKIKKMFQENIVAQLECIESQLEKFKYVKTGNRNILTESDIQRFVRKYFSNNPQDIIDGLSLLFKLNTLLLQDEPGQMSVKNIPQFFNLLKFVNRDAVQIIDIVEIMRDEKDPTRFMANRAELEKVLTRFSGAILGIVQNANGRDQSINIEDLILDLTKNLKDFKLGRELLNSLLFVKKLFLGGSRVYISTNEALTMFKKFPIFGMNIFDIFLLKEEVFTSKAEYFEHIAHNLELLKANVFQHQNEELILTTTDLDRIIDEFLNDNKGLGDIFGTDAVQRAEELKKIVRSFKRDLVGGDEVYFTYRDIEVTLAFINVGVRSFEKISKIGDLVKDIDGKDLSKKLEIKAEFLLTFRELSTKVKELIEGSQDIPTQLKLLKFMQSLATDTDYLNFDPKLISSIFSIKVASVGGTRELTTIPELLRALDRAEDFAKLYFDLQYLSKDYFDLSAKAKFLFFERQITQLSNLLLDDSEVENVLSTADVEIIIDQFFKDTDEDKEKGVALKAFFQNFKGNLIGTTKDYLNFKEVKETVSIAVIAFKALVFSSFHDELKKSIEAGQTTKEAGKISYAVEFEKINAELKKFLSNDFTIKSPIKLYDFIEALKESKSIFNFDTELILLGTTFKSAILGGDNKTVTKTELSYVTTKMNLISGIAFDLLFNKFDEIKPNANLYKFILENLKNARLIIPEFAPNTPHFSLKQGLLFADKLVAYINDNSDEPKDTDDLISPSNFKRTIIDLTERILSPIARKDLSYPAPCKPDPKNKGKYLCSQDEPGNAPEIDLVVTSTIFNNLLDLAQEAIESLYFSEVTYDYFAKEMLDTKPVTISFYPNLPEYDILTPKYILKVKASFADVAKNNKYFRDERTMSYYQRDIVRNKIGFGSLVLMRTVLPYILGGYGPEGYTGDPTKAQGLEIYQLQEFLVGIKSVLQELGLWTNNFESFGQNILLLADLFQSRSNGDLFINLNEASEFVELIMMSGKLGSNMIEVLQKKCEVTYTEDKKERVNTECVRKNFFETLFVDLELQKYFPRLNKYNTEASKKEMIEYIKGVEGFARDVPDLNIPWEIRDFTLVLGAMLNIESTFLRFDTSYDNRLDFNELNKALDVYRGAIILLAKLEGKNTKLARTVFFYMVKYMKAPAPLTVWSLDKIFKIHFKKVKATRLNIGALLFYLVNSQDEKLDEQSVNENVTPNKTEVDNLSQLGNLVGPYTDYLAAKTSEEVDNIINNIQYIYNDTKEFVGL